MQKRLRRSELEVGVLKSMSPHTSTVLPANRRSLMPTAPECPRLHMPELEFSGLLKRGCLFHMRMFRAEDLVVYSHGCQVNQP